MKKIVLDTKQDTIPLQGVPAIFPIWVHTPTGTAHGMVVRSDSNQWSVVTPSDKSHANFSSRKELIEQLLGDGYTCWSEYED